MHFNRCAKVSGKCPDSVNMCESISVATARLDLWLQLSYDISLYSTPRDHNPPKPAAPESDDGKGTAKN